MTIEKRKLSEVTLAETAADNANVLIEEEGAIKRVPKTAVGGGNSIVLKEKPYAGSEEMHGSFFELKDFVYGDSEQKTYYVYIYDGRFWFEEANETGYPTGWPTQE